MVNNRAKQIIFRYYEIAAFVIFVAVTAWFYKYSPKGKDEITAYLTVVGSLFTFFYFIQKQQLEELTLFKGLFTDFNKRYDEMNDKVNKIANAEIKRPLTPEEKDILDDYFNLCSEEYLFHRKGYIYDEVWVAWSNGMRFFLNKDVRIREYWLTEKETNSYYGLDILPDKTGEST
ncbi:MAG: hypothetical protein ACREBD_39415 [Blastocatellia bacterium]